MSKLEDSLGLPHHELEEEITVDDYKADDLEYVKDNLKTMISQGMSSIQVLSLIAKTAENPRAFESLAALMKIMLDANKQYHDVSKPKDTEPTQKEETKKIPKMTTLQLLEQNVKDDE